MNTLQEIQKLGEILRTRKQELQDLELQVSAKKAAIRDIEEVTLPTLMDETGIEGIDLTGGGRIEVKDFVAAKISEANEAQAFDWLRETGNDGIIKNEIQVRLDRGQDERAKRIMEDLDARGVPYHYKPTIHHSTLKAFVTEALANPELRDQLPREAFGVYESRKVVFK